jgi:hypothetical protein
MLHEATDMAHVLGIGGYVGEVREAPDGQLYEWVEGVDGLGNPIGFWRKLKRIGGKAFRGVKGALRAVRPFARFALPFTKFIPGVGPAIYAAGTLAQRAGILGVGETAQGGKPRKIVFPPSSLSVGEERFIDDKIAQGERDENKITDSVFHGRHPKRGGARLTSKETALIQEWKRIRAIVQVKLLVARLFQGSGLQGTGVIGQGSDGQLYEYVEGVDGLGNPIGFWRKLRRAAGGLIRKATGLVRGGLPGVVGKLAQQIPGIQKITGVTKQVCRFLPRLEPCVQQFPQAMPAYRTGVQVCNALRKAGLAGADGSLMEAPDGQLYEVVEGVGEFGEPRRVLRPGWLSIPAAIGPRGVVPGGRVIPARRPVVAAPVRQPVVARPAAPVVSRFRRFR